MSTFQKDLLGDKKRGGGAMEGSSPGASTPNQQVVRGVERHAGGLAGCRKCFSWVSSGAGRDLYGEKMYTDSLGVVWVIRVLSYMILLKLLVGTGVPQRATLALLLGRWPMLGRLAANWGAERPDSAHS